jgi:hypothetical protein
MAPYYHQQPQDRPTVQYSPVPSVLMQPRMSVMSTSTQPMMYYPPQQPRGTHEPVQQPPPVRRQSTVQLSPQGTVQYIVPHERSQSRGSNNGSHNGSHHSSQNGSSDDNSMPGLVYHPPRWVMDLFQRLDKINEEIQFTRQYVTQYMGHLAQNNQPPQQQQQSRHPPQQQAQPQPYRR